MTQPNKAFAQLTQSISGSHVGAQYTVLAPDDGNLTAPGDAVVAITFTYSDNSESIHQALADAIRVRQDDDSLSVTFLDSPGRY